MKKLLLITLFIGLITTSFAQDNYIGEIRIFAGYYAPSGWAFCNGQKMSISQNQALFSIIGNYFGGDGVTTFNLPDLRGRVPIHYGQAPGLSPILFGEMNGTESNTVVPFQPFAKTSGTKFNTTTTGGDGAPFAVQSVEVVNPTVSQILNNRQPYLGLNFIIALTGIYPVRN